MFEDRTSPTAACFGAFELDLTAGELRKRGVRLHLQEQPFQVLKALLARPGEIVTREELVAQLWPDGTFVEFDRGLNAAVARLRQVLQDSAENPRYVETVARRGYRFVAAVEFAAPTASTGPTVQEASPAAEAGSVARRSTGLLAAVGVALLLIIVAFAMLRRPGSTVDRPRQAVPLTAALGIAEPPTFSPDGRLVAFSWKPEGEERSHIFIKALDAEAMRQLTFGTDADESPAWSPDGRFIALMRRGAGGNVVHYVISASGGEPRFVYETSYRGPAVRSPIQQAWTSNGKELIVSDRPRLYAVTFETGQVRPLTGPIDEQVDIAPAVSPDGATIAFIRSQGRGWAILVMPSGGGDPRVIIPWDRDVDRAGLAWTPDGTHLVYRSAHGGIQEVSVAGGILRQLRAGGEKARSPAVSSRGDLAFIEPVEQFAVRKIDRRTELPGSTSSLLQSTRAVFDPQWSPDGKHIAFYSDRSGSTEIWVSDANGNNLRQLTSFGGPITRNPRWSPNGEFVAFDSVVDGHPQLHVIDASGGNLRKLTEGRFNNLLPAWSNDGKTLYFTSDRSGSLQIWRMPAGGGIATQTTFLGGFFPAISIDDGLFYVRQPGAKSLLRMPAAGGREEVVLADSLEMQAWWGLARTGVAYIDRQLTLRFFDLIQKTQSGPIAQFKPTELRWETTIGVSADGRSVLCPVVQRSSSDVMIVRGLW